MHKPFIRINAICNTSISTWGWMTFCSTMLLIARSTMLVMDFPWHSWWTAGHRTIRRMPEVTRVFGSTKSVTRNTTTSVPRIQGYQYCKFGLRIFLVNYDIVDKLIAYLLVLPWTWRGRCVSAPRVSYFLWLHYKYFRTGILASIINPWWILDSNVFKGLVSYKHCM